MRSEGEQLETSNLILACDHRRGAACGRQREGEQLEIREGEQLEIRKEVQLEIRDEQLVIGKEKESSVRS